MSAQYANSRGNTANIAYFVSMVENFAKENHLEYQIIQDNLEQECPLHYAVGKGSV